MGSLSTRAPHLQLLSIEGDVVEEIEEENEVDLSFDAIYARYAPYVASIGLRLLGRPDEVDDLVQEVFLTAHRKMHQLKKARSAKSWLATIAVRQCWRRLRRRRLWNFIGLEVWREYDTIPDPSAPPEIRAQVTALFRALDDLPPDLRVAWTLRHLEGEKLEVVADLCGCSVRTVKRRIKKARSLLEEVLDG